MKKFISLLLSAAMLIMSLPGVVSADAAGAEFEVVASSDFDALTVEPGSGNAADGMSLDTTTYASDVLYGNAVKLIGTASVDGKKTYNQAIYTFDEAITASGNNCYVETEYDVILTTNANHTIYFNGALGTAIYVEKSTGKLYHGYGNTGTYLGQSDSLMNGEWTRLKFVMQLTGANGTAVNRLVDIYANGSSIMEEGVTVDLKSTVSYTTFYLQMSSGGGRTLWLDNLKVTQYNLENETDESPVPEKTTLGTKITELYSKLKSNSANIESATYNEIKAEIDALLVVYEKADATKSEVSTAETQAATISDKIDAAASGPDDGNGDDNDDDDDDDDDGSIPEATDFRITALETFDGVSKGVAYSNTGSNAEIVSSGDETIKKNALHYYNTQDTSAAPFMTFNFNEALAASKAGGAQPGMFIETSFDFKNEMTSGKNLFFKFSNSGSDIAPLIILVPNKEVRLESTSGDIVGTISPEDWCNVRFVMQITDDAGNDVRKIVAIYVDGVNTLTTPVSLLTGNTYNQLRIQLSNFKTSDTLGLEFGAEFDNICVTTYNTTGNKPRANDRTLISVYASNIMASLDKYLMLNENYESLKAQALEKVALYTDPTATASEIDEAVTTLATLKKKVDALVNMQEEEKTSYMYAPELSADSLSGQSSVTADMTFVTTTGSVKSEIIGVLYKKSDDVFGGEMLSVVRETANAGADTVLDKSITFDLSGYSEAEKADMFIKIFTVSDLTSMNFNNTEQYSFFAPETAIDSSESFAEGVNAAMSITPDAQKMVIKANMGKANAGKLILAVALKHGEKFENLTFTSDEITALSTEGEASGPIVYANQTVVDANGYAMFEFVPAVDDAGEKIEGSYSYIVRCEGQSPVRGTLQYCSAETMNDAFTALYASKTEETLSNYLDELYVDETLFNSYKAALDMGEILTYVLGQKTYDAYSVNEFSGSMNDYMKFIGGINSAAAVSQIEEMMSTYGHLSAYSSQYNALTALQKYNANSYILDNRGSVTSKATADDVIYSAITASTSSGGSSGGSGGSGGSSGGSGGSGGGVGVGGFSAVTNNSQSVTPVDKNSTLFTDLDSVEWAREAISMLATAGSVSGKAEGVFAPNDSITREEFVKIVVTAFGYYDPEAVSSFSDVGAGSWCASYIASAVNAGLINGIDENNFGVGRQITREDMAVIIHRILTNKGKGITEDGVYIEFNDEVKFADYAREAIMDLAKSNIVNGNGSNEFMPKSNATRAEAAKMIYEAYMRAE